MEQLLGENKYNYLILNEKLDTVKNGPDIYVKLRVNSNQFFVPVSMPRRDPSLQFDLEKPDNDLWIYLDECERKLSGDSIKHWIKEQRENITATFPEGKKQSVTCKLMLELLENPTVCSKCFLNRTGNPNPQKNIQHLRDKGYIICTHKCFCESCQKTQTSYSITPVLKSLKQTYEIIPKALKKRICQTLKYTNAYTGIENSEPASHIADHKFPEDRWDENTPVDNSIEMSESEIRGKFQLLDTQTNMQKQRFCGECIRTRKRGYPFGIKFYYEGKEDWDPNIPEKGTEAEKGCIGCGWYDIEEWRTQLNKYLSKEKAED